MQTSYGERATTGQALTFEEGIEVPAPVAEVYRRWTDFSRFPEFMQNVKEVRPLGGGRYHWVANILGTKQEWDAEVTDKEENQRISWRNLNGATNTGTVTFNPLPNNRTRVYLRMEHTPPGGVMGKNLEKVTHATRRVVKQDLENFSRAVRGERDLGPSEGPQGFTPVLGALAIPIATGVIGGITASVIERNRFRRSMLFGLRAAEFREPVEAPARIASWVLTTAAVGSIITSAIHRARGDRTNALFTGQWVPTLLGASILSRMIGHRGVNPSRGASIASWTLTGAAAGSIVSSVISHMRSRRHDGLFIGQWAPTLLAGALFSRLIRRW
ncbi:MAG TPA: SRPBCC family protein [Ktedonobacterales bacterium]|jgi:uncharacterized membrane protein